MLRRLALLITALGAGCGAPHAEDATSQKLRGGVGGILASQAPRGEARYVPISETDEDQVFEGSSEGGKRVMTAGVRLVTLPNGGVLSSSEPLIAEPLETVEVPARMGGGFLFRIGSMLYRASDWLSPVHPIFAAPPTQTMSRVVVGLDRVYVQLASTAFLPIDPVSGQSLDAGTFPRSPYVASMVTLDGWRAVAIVDARGVVVTEDAGATWSPIKLPIEPATLVQTGDSVAVSGVEPGRGGTTWFEVSTDGRFGRLARAPDEEAASSPSSAAPASPGPFGARPLVAAIEDGWPLTDGTALVARDGALGRIRIEDGVLVEVAHDAFPMKPARCHPFSLARPTSPAAFGFVCGEPRGPTELYAFDPHGGQLAPLRHFDAPRVVVSSGNGALVVRGPCAPDAPSDDPTPGQQTYCVLGHSNAFTDFVVRGDIGAERVVALADGRNVVISPPQGTLPQARLTILEKGGAKTVPIVFATDPGARTKDQLYDSEALTRALRSGAWLEGFQERRTGVISGWVLSGNTAVGIEIKLDGTAKHGEFVRDMGAPVVSGQYGLSWSGQGGHETTDGGMSWRQVHLPDSLWKKGARSDATRACGPIGCETAGWLRIGWGSHPPGPPIQPQGALTQGVPSQYPLQLRCEVAGTKPALTATTAAPPSVSSTKAKEWYAFYGVPAPKLGDDDAGYGLEAASVLNTPPKPTQFVQQQKGLAHLYSWGPRDVVDWASKGRALVRWVSPFDSSANMHSSQLGSIPKFIAEAYMPTLTQPRQQPGLQAGGLTFGEDGAHALWVVQGGNRYGYGYGGSTTVVGGVLLLEADRGATEIRRTDGEPIGALDSAVHAGGRWYLATGADSDEPTATVVWEVEAGIAHELVRLPRAGVSGAALSVGLTRSADDRSVGVIINGQPSADRFQTQQLWVVPIELATGAVGEPQVLGPVDLTNSARACERGTGGWILEAQWRNSLRVDLGDGATAMNATFARFHVSPGHVCVDRVATSDDVSAELLKRPKHPSVGDAATVNVTVLAEGTRQVLRCATGP